MLNYKFITDKHLTKQPNLADYQQAYDNFNVKDYWGELEWFNGGKINAAFNACDRHLKDPRKRNKTALIWVSEDNQIQTFTFEQIANLSNQVANGLKSLGVNPRDRVFIFLPRIPQLYYAFLGIVKTGAIAGTMFSAFGSQAITDRLGNSQAKILITDSQLLPRVKESLSNLPNLEKILVVGGQNEGEKIFNFDQLVAVQDRSFNIYQANPEDFAFMLYTSGTTGKPKGVVHAHLAILHEHLTAKWVLDLKDDDIYWCTADPGWVTGIAYEILGTWSNAATTVVYAGRFDPERWYSIISQLKVTVWYTAPTAVRMLMAADPSLLSKYNLSSLRHLVCVGEPLNPEAVIWSYQTFGKPFHDSWWQTETGGIMIANYPVMPIKPGSMGKPVPGVIAEIVDEEGKVVGTGVEGNLAIKPGWPSMMRTIWQNPEKYQSYFVNGWYISGDRAYKDEDGYFWFIGRADDVIKTSGERVGPFEVESALVEHPAVVEAGVIGKPDPVRGEIIKAFVVLKPGVNGDDDLKQVLMAFVKKHLAGHAYPREIEFIDKLPKTRSGKIMRRLLKAKELGLPVGDTSTLEEY